MVPQQCVCVCSCFLCSYFWRSEVRFHSDHRWRRAIELSASAESIVKFNLLQICDIASTAAFVLSDVLVWSCQAQVMCGWWRDAQEIHTAAFILNQKSSLMQSNTHTCNLTGKHTNAICPIKWAETPSHYM